MSLDSESTNQPALKKWEFFAGWAMTSIALGAATLPSAWRSAGGAAWGLTWLCAWSSCELLLGPLGGILRASWVPSRKFWVVPSGLVIAGLPIAAFADLLQRVTHHRPLGAATFALSALALTLICIAFSARALLGSGLSRSLTWSYRVLLTGSGFGLTFWCVQLLIGGSAGLRWGLADALLLLGAVVTSLLPTGTGATALSTWPKVPCPTRPNARRMLQWFGPVLWAALLLVGLATRNDSSSGVRALKESAPVVYGLGRWLGE